jgi:hypothetical protein
MDASNTGPSAEASKLGPPEEPLLFGLHAELAITRTRRSGAVGSAST